MTFGLVRCVMVLYCNYLYPLLSKIRYAYLSFYDADFIVLL